jgi:phenylpyruvate tautomerase PptA (4-oxalocrotonate tautomerase family)
MPIVHVRMVIEDGRFPPKGTARALSEALANVFLAPPGRVWVQLECIPEDHYAENGSSERAQPVFVQVLLADLPPPPELEQQAAALAAAVARVAERSPEHVHIEYAPPGRGRVAFGGVLLQ